MSINMDINGFNIDKYKRYKTEILRGKNYEENYFYYPCNHYDCNFKWLSICNEAFWW